MPLPVTPVQAALIREWITRRADQYTNDDPIAARDLIYDAIIATPTELEAAVEAFRLDMIAELQAQVTSAESSIDTLNAQITALGGTP